MPSPASQRGHERAILEARYPARQRADYEFPRKRLNNGSNGSESETPRRYVGAEEVEDDGEPFEEKMPRLVAELQAQFAESAKLEKAIKANLKGLGYGG